MIKNKEIENLNIPKIENEIKDIVDREIRAWDTQDVDLLLSIFHHDMVLPWPKSNQENDPINWVLELGKFNYDRWKNS
ncbi:MAG: hypothetical protein KGD57_03525 [Candidatus Lokiarchaeota archaeon]|nr:hypothetical protein [Candidatus Lokiarchaeota archaeon]